MNFPTVPPSPSIAVLDIPSFSRYLYGTQSAIILTTRHNHMPTDRRVRRTKNLLRQALIALALEEGYRAVTIQEVTERADIGYRTFFRHYDSLDALLRDVAQSVLDELSGKLALFQPVSDPGILTERGTALFAYVHQHADIFRVLLLDDSILFVLRPVIEGTRQRLSEGLTVMQTGSYPAGLVATHLVTATFGLMRWYLENDFPETPERMGEIFSSLIVQPTWQAVAVSAPAPQADTPEL